MESEQLIAAGTGSQTGGLTRWGDYSSMTVDPADDCTFWYTQEYIKANGTFNWSTRISNFKFSNCGAPIAAVSLSPLSLNFGKIAIRHTSAAQSVKLTNTGTATLQISSIAVSGDFAVSNRTCGSQLNPGSSCAVSVTFTPIAAGARTGTLSFRDNAPNSPQSIPLTGTGSSSALAPETPARTPHSGTNSGMVLPARSVSMED